MGKKYRKVEFSWGGTLEDAVLDLLYYKRKGELVYGEFNGVKLYSDTVTMNDAYKKVIGKTKSEFDKGQKEWRNKYQKEEREHREQIATLAEMWIKRGQKILTEDKWDYWAEIVPIGLGDLYRGMELGYCLEIIEVLNNGGTLDEARELIKNQSHSGLSFSLVCSMVKDFSDRGKEFVEYVS